MKRAIFRFDYDNKVEDFFLICCEGGTELQIIDELICYLQSIKQFFFIERDF